MIYADMSTLLKRHVAEDASERVASFIEAEPTLAISRLTKAARKLDLEIDAFVA